MRSLIVFSLIFPALAMTPLALASDDPRQERHELMEDTRDAAKPIGQMMRGEADYDADVLMSSLKTMLYVSDRFGGLFPAGTETGMDTEAAPAIWEDREGFDQALANWRSALKAAVAAGPATLEEARPAVGPVFRACKDCHDSYRIDDE